MLVYIMKNTRLRKADKNCIIFLFVVFLFLIIEISSVSFSSSDENIYFYMGKMILEGQIPYKDFFYSNLPLEILAIAVFLQLVGSKIILLKLVPIFITVISGYVLFRMLKKRFDSSYALISSTLYLFSFIVLSTAQYWVGVQLTTMFILISCYFIYEKKYLLGGIIASLALMVRLYALFAITGIIVYLLIKNRESCLRFFKGVMILFLSVNIILFFLFRERYIIPVFLYTLLRTGGVFRFEVLKNFLVGDAILVLLSLVALFLKDKKKLLLPFLVAGFIITSYMLYRDVYSMYFAFVAPFLAILGGYVLYSLVKNISSYKHVLTLCIIIFFIVQNSYIYIRQYSPAQSIDFIDDIKGFVEKNSTPDDKIYGDSGITPLIALLSGRKIVNNYVDTNRKTFDSGLFDVNERTNSIRGKVRFVIIRVLVGSKGDVTGVREIIDQKFLSEECSLVNSYSIKENQENCAILLFDCNPNIKITSQKSPPF